MKIISYSHKDISERKFCGGEYCVCLYFYSPLFFVNPTVEYEKKEENYVLLRKLAPFSYMKSVWQNSSKQRAASCCYFSTDTSSSEGILLEENLLSIGILCTSGGQSLGNTHEKNNPVDNAKDITLTQVFLSSVAAALHIQPQRKKRLYEEGEFGI